MEATMTILHANPFEDRLALSRLYLIAGAPGGGPVGTAGEAEENWLARIRAAVHGGVDLVQLRAKGMPTADVVRLARKLKTALAGSTALVIVNDDPAAAFAADADGVHLGQQDESVAAARSTLGLGRLIGISTHSIEQAAAAQRAGADYLGCGAAFATSTKDSIELIGPRAIGAVVARSEIPVFAIGGIKLDNLAELRACGVQRIAVSSSIMEAADPERTARAFRDALAGPIRSGG
jgi:thiamine-phosphate pyrophosphorylase